MKNPKTVEDWIIWGKQSKRRIFFYKNKVLDLTDYIRHHPDAVQAVKAYIYNDLTQAFSNGYLYNQEAVLRTIMGYEIGTILQIKNKQLNKRLSKSISNSNNLKFQTSSPRMTTSHHKQNVKRVMNSSAKRQQKCSKITRNSAMTRSDRPNQPQIQARKKQFLTSIRLIEDNMTKTYDQYYKECMIKKQQNFALKISKKNKNVQHSYSILNFELDEEKPNLMVPVLAVKPFYRKDS